MEQQARRSMRGGGQQFNSEQETIKLRELHNRSLKDGSKSVKYLGEQAQNAGTALSNVVTGVANFLLSLTKAVDSGVAGALKVAFDGSTPKITQFTDVLSQVAIPGLKTLGASASILDSAITDFRELSQVGADLGNSLLAVKTRAAEANLPLEVYKKVITESSASLALAGGSASQGALQFTRVSGGVQKMREQFSRLGLSMEETAEYTASFLEQQQRAGRLSSMTEAEQIQKAQQYNLELDKMSRATGIQRKALDEANKQAQLDVRMRTALRNLTQSDRGTFNARMEQLTKSGAEPFAKGLRDLVAGVGVPLTEEAKGIAVALGKSGIDIQGITRRIAQGVPGSVEELQKALAQGAVVANDLSEEQKRLVTQTATQGKQLPDYFLLMLQGNENIADSAKTAANEQAVALETSRKSLANLDGVLLNVRNTLLELFMPMLLKAEAIGADAVQKLGPDGEYMQAIKTFAQGVANRANEFLTTLQEQGPSEAFRKLWEDLTEWGKPYIERMWAELTRFMKEKINPFVNEMMTTLTNSVLTGVKDLFTSPAVIGAMVAGITALVGAALAYSGLKRLGDVPGAMLEGSRRGRNLRPGLVPGDGSRNSWMDRLKGGAAGAAKEGAKGLGKSALRFVPGVGLVYGAYEMGSVAMDDSLSTMQKSEQIGGLAGGMGGAATGAALGALGGPIGVLLGSIIGGAVGYFGGSKAGEAVGSSLTDVNSQAAKLRNVPKPEEESTTAPATPATTNTATQTDPGDGQITTPKKETATPTPEKISSDLLTDLNNKVASLIEMQSEANSNLKRIAGNTKGNLA
jgi:hypothetical protein